MIGKTKFNVRVTPKDIELFEYLHAMKVATVDQVHRDIYSHLKKTGVYCRLRRLQRAGLIRSYQDFESGGQKVISLKKPTFDRYLSNAEERALELKSDAVKHDLTLNNIRHRLLQCTRVKRYYSENQIQTWSDTLRNGSFIDLAGFHNDAVVEIQFDDDILLIPLEYEGSLKQFNRNEEIVKRIYSRQNIQAILYVCSEKGMIDKFKRIEERFFKDRTPKFFYKLLQELSSDEAMSFTNRNDEALDLNQN